jgi:hypothetical protein
VTRSGLYKHINRIKTVLQLDKKLFDDNVTQNQVSILAQEMLLPMIGKTRLSLTDATIILFFYRRIFGSKNTNFTDYSNVKTALAIMIKKLKI